MKLIFSLALLSGAALGQAFTQVSGVAKDSQGNLYQNCVFSIHFVGQSTQPGPYLLQGSVFQQTFAGIRCDGFGNFSIRLPSNQAIFPQPSSWVFNICDSSGHFCNASGTAIITIAGAAQDVTAIMTPVLPILPPPGAAVSSVFGRSGQVVAVSGDYDVSQVTGAAPVASPTFTGLPQVPTATVGTFNNQAASTAFVLTAIGNAIGGGGGGGTLPPTAPGNTLFGNNSVGTSAPSFFNPGGDVSFSSGNFSVNALHFGPNALSLSNTGIATGNCLQVQGSTIVGGACGTGGGGAVSSVFGRTGAIAATAGDYLVSQVTGAAPLESPVFTGIPAGPTAAVGTNTTQLATTAFVLANQGGAAGVTSFNGRTGAVVPQAADYSAFFAPIGGGGGLSGSGTVNLIPKFTAATALGNSLLTDNGTTLSYSGTGGIVASKFSNGTATGPFQLESAVGALPGLPGAGKNALVSGPDGWYVSNANSAYFKIEPPGTGGTGGAVSSVFGRTGTVLQQTGDYNITQITNGASTVSPIFTGTPTAPTALQTVSNTQLATTAFVHAAVAAGGGGPGAVSSVFGRTGDVVAAANDYTFAQVLGAAPLLSPEFIGTPKAPTPPANDNSTNIATTAWVKANAGGGGGGAVVPIGRSAMTPACYSNDVATDATKTFTGLNIVTGDTVMIGLISGYLPIATEHAQITDSGSNNYTFITSTTAATGTTTRVSLFSTAAVHAANTLTVTQAAASKFVVCIAPYVGVSNVNASNVHGTFLTNTLTQTATLNVEAGGFIFAAANIGAALTATWGPGTPLADGYKASTTPQPAVGGICENTSVAAGPATCTVLWSGSTNYGNGIVAVELQPGATGPAPPSGGVTNFTSGNLSPLFTTAVATPATTPALTFTLSHAPANTMLGNNTAASAAPAWVPIPTGGGGVSSVFGRSDAVTAQAGDYLVGQVIGAAPLASPIFTGIPAAPTATAGTNTTQLATTAFVHDAISAGGGGTPIPIQHSAQPAKCQAQNSGGPGTLTGLDIRAGDTVVVGITINYSIGGIPSVPATVTDSGGSTYDLLTGELTASNVYAWLYATPAGGAHQATQINVQSQPTSKYVTCIAVYKGVGGLGAHYDNGSASAVSNATAVSLTTIDNNSFVVGFIGTNTNTILSAQSTPVGNFLAQQSTTTPNVTTGGICDASSPTPAVTHCTMAFSSASAFNALGIELRCCATTGGGGVATFNGRSGTVFPALNDYNFSQIAGTVSSSQLGSAPAHTMLGNNTGAAAVASWVPIPSGGVGMSKIAGGTTNIPGTVSVDADSCANLAVTTGTTTPSATGVLQTDVVSWSFQPAASGWANGRITLRPEAFAGTITWRACNSGTTAYTPTARDINWYVAR